jgi:hypothetical protein
MNRLLIVAVLLFVSNVANAFEIFALGTSNTNCKGVDRSKIFTVRLEELLHASGIDVKVINAGIDGDKPMWMLNRLQQGVTDQTKLVLFEPGPNDRNKSSNVESSEKILAALQKMSMPTIYISAPIIQTNTEAQETAKKYGAYYYGHWIKDVPVDRVHRQYDLAGGGHMTAEGCQLWASNILPLVKQVLEERSIK